MITHPQPQSAALRQVMTGYWGFSEFRPLQERAMLAVLAGRDSLVVLPTGGGKSVCYQAPAMVRGGTTVVISPLIALMKDQVDALRAIDIPALQIDSSLSEEDRWSGEMAVRQGKIRLLFASPERLVTPGFQDLLRAAGASTFAIDEAHCISHWGHDFRPEYRQLNRLKRVFPDSAVHAYTATATPRVRQDIASQLGLADPEVLVGDFDRPNLTYRVLPRRDLLTEVTTIIERHRGEPGIIYCLRRKDVDELADSLAQLGYRVRAYHAGMSPEDRRLAQDDFKADRCDIVVATIAFGMGIDRSNIRYVLHTALPKSVEHYQQETGRAGRDGLEAECVLLYSGADAVTWKKILQKSAADPAVDPGFLPNALKHLDDMDRYCRGGLCRHRVLVEYFGQKHAGTCRACDVCLGDMEPVPDALIIAQKILSCVARVKERFGAGHVVCVLRGETNERVTSRGHHQLSTFGLLRDHGAREIRDWIYQLVAQEALAQSDDEYRILQLTPAAWEIMKGTRAVTLHRSAQTRVTKSRAAQVSWQGVDAGLFEHLRQIRLQRAEALRLPAYVVFSDVTLRALAAVRPTSLDRMRLIRGIGDRKLTDFGDEFIQAIDDYCRKNNLPTDITAALADGIQKKPSKRKLQAYEWFREGRDLETVIKWLGLARRTVCGYLCDYISLERPASIAQWVRGERYQAIAKATQQIGGERLTPIFEALHGQYAYDEIRLVVTHLDVTGGGKPG
jgi:ATP-dependent DNA helicase RecQ